MRQSWFQTHLSTNWQSEARLLKFIVNFDPKSIRTYCFGECVLGKDMFMTSRQQDLVCTTFPSDTVCFQRLPRLLKQNLGQWTYQKYAEGRKWLTSHKHVRQTKGFFDHFYHSVISLFISSHITIFVVMHLLLRSSGRFKVIIR